MRNRGVTPVGGIGASDLRPIVDASGPFVTLLLDTNPKVANAAFELDQRWKTVRRELASTGAPDAPLSQLDDLVPDAHLKGHALYAIADSEQTWVTAHWPEQPRHELARWAPLPTLTPLLAQRQVAVPHVVVLVDREGADLVTVTPETTHDETVAGVTGPVIHRSAPGGWSQKRYQTRAEDAWARTARDVSEALVAQVDAAHAELVVMAGDVRAVQLVTEDLPARVSDRLHVVAGGRAAGTDKAALADTVTRLVRTAAAEASVALLQKLREEIGQNDRAVVGPEATFEALGRGQIEVLFVHDDPDDDRSAWFGNAPLAAGLDADTARRDDGEVRQGRLIDVAVRSAIGSGAEIRVIPEIGPVAGSVAGILRWTE